MATFTIAKTGEETGERINYTANTANTGDSATYQCYLYCPTDFQKAISFGQTPNPVLTASPQPTAIFC